MPRTLTLGDLYNLLAPLPMREDSSRRTDPMTLDLDKLEAAAAGFANTKLHVATEDRIWWTSERDVDDGCFAESIEPHIAEPLCEIVNASAALIARVRELEAGRKELKRAASHLCACVAEYAARHGRTADRRTRVVTETEIERAADRLRALLTEEPTP
jgi:hypothetical protein